MSMAKGSIPQSWHTNYNQTDIMNLKGMENKGGKEEDNNREKRGEKRKKK